MHVRILYTHAAMHLTELIKDGIINQLDIFWSHLSKYKHMTKYVMWSHLYILIPLRLCDDLKEPRHTSWLICLLNRQVSD